jgi:hypothetical protein
MKNCKPVISPMATSEKLYVLQETPLGQQDSPLIAFVAKGPQKYG